MLMEATTFLTTQRKNKRKRREHFQIPLGQNKTELTISSIPEELTMHDSKKERGTL